MINNTTATIGRDALGYGAAKHNAGAALATGIRITDADARKLAQELAANSYNIVADFGRGEFDPARLAFGPVLREWFAELDSFAWSALHGDDEDALLRGALARYARQQCESPSWASPTPAREPAADTRDS